LVKFKEACLLSAFWVAIALLFNLFIYFYFGSDWALQFFTGYLIEKSLSVDNLFLFLMIFAHFQTLAAYQRKILFWGILGVLFFRISLILTGVALIDEFHWMFYVFGVFLLLSGVNFMLQKDKVEDPSKSFLYRTFSKIFPVAKGDGGGHFFVRSQGKWKVTSLFLALLMIESTDIVLALDSVPAIFAVTTNPFIIYTSNIFAILGLRALYFVVASSLKKLRYFKYGLAAILVFVGIKMLLADVAPISLPVSLAVILMILGVTMLMSRTR
jgi:tellurite resistance protein TerC